MTPQIFRTRENKMEKFKVVNNINGSLGFYLNPSPESFRALPKQGAFIPLTLDEIQYIHINQEIIQKGMLWLEDKQLRVDFGIENEDGTKGNPNVLLHGEIVELIQGNYKKLEKAIDEITEQSTLDQFVTVARELKIDSKAKIDIIEKATKAKIFEEED